MTTVTSRGHTNTLTSTPNASEPSYSESLKPTNPLTSLSVEELALYTDFSLQESCQPEREKDVSLMCDLTQLQQDVSEGIQNISSDMTTEQKQQG